MTTSAVSICNGAAILMGSEATITSLADDNKLARVLSANYDDVRRNELRAHRWRFSITRASLAALSTAPISDYVRQFQLPNDYLRLIEGGDIWEVADVSDVRAGVGSPLYSIERSTAGTLAILTNLGAPLKIRYLADVTDTALFDPCFVAAFSAALAQASSDAITQSDTKNARLDRVYKDALRTAIRANALEVASQFPIDDSFAAARAL